MSRVEQFGPFKASDKGNDSTSGQTSSPRKIKGVCNFVCMCVCWGMKKEREREAWGGGVNGSN